MENRESKAKALRETGGKSSRANKEDKNRNQDGNRGRRCPAKNMIVSIRYVKGIFYNEV